MELEGSTRSWSYGVPSIIKEEQMNSISRRIVRVLTSGALLVLTAATVRPADAGEAFPKLNIKVGTVAVGEPFFHKGSMKFAELVKERTAGAVNVQLFPASQLGNEKELVEQVKNGVIEMTMATIPVVSVFKGWERIGVFGMPYIFKGDTDDVRVAQLRKIARGPIGREIIESAAKASGVRGLDLAWWGGMQHLTTRSKQVTKVGDVNGLKIRIADAPIYGLALKAFGAKVTPMAWSETYTALQLGVVDGMANTSDILYNAKMHEVQKYLALTGHVPVIFVVLINDQFYLRLPPELRAILDKAATEAGDYQIDLALKGGMEYLEKLKTAGMTISPMNMAELAERTKDSWREFEPQFGKGFYERVVEALK
jgi:tripartite ATP-independent transporter DctP family solute receptor